MSDDKFWEDMKAKGMPEHLIYEARVREREPDLAGLIGGVMVATLIFALMLATGWVLYTLLRLVAEVIIS